MKSITIHGIDNELTQLISDKAQRHGTSLNQTIKMLLQESLGVSKQQRKSDFSEFSGIWTRKEFEEFERSAKDFEKIDSRDWR